MLRRLTDRWSPRERRQRLLQQVDEQVQRALAAHDAALPERLLSTPLVFGPPERVHIDPTAVLNDALINVSSGDVFIEPYAFFGHRVAVLTGTHDIAERDLARQQAIPQHGRDIRVERGAWVSTGAMLVGPVTIGEHSVVAAGSVVTRDVPPYAVVAGNPAREIRRLDR